MARLAGRIHHALLSATPVVFNGYAMLFAFSTYFCMYAFRKPFSAAQYEGLYLWDTKIELKTAFVIGQIVGYALSKFLGIKVCSEATRRNRACLLLGLIAAAEMALVLFAILPRDWKLLAIFLNGLPLGMVWGLVVWYLEGRRTSEILMAGLSCSFIVSSGVVKDVGRALMAGDAIHLLGLSLTNPFPAVDEFWMPAATGLLFFPVLAGSVWFLDCLPDPTPEDIAARTLRKTMNSKERRHFVASYWPGLVMLLVAYFFLTAFRDYRDNYMVEILDELGYSYESHRDLISHMEFGVALGVMIAMAMLYFIPNNRTALLAVIAVMTVGLMLTGCSTWLRHLNLLSGVAWMTLIGLGTYLAYVPFNSVLFDRLIASTHFAGTAVFAIYLADSMGYTGSIALQLSKDIAAAQTTRLGFLEGYSYVLSGIGTLLLGGSGLYFSRMISQEESFPEQAQVSLFAEATHN